MSLESGISINMIALNPPHNAGKEVFLPPSQSVLNSFEGLQQPRTILHETVSSKNLSQARTDFTQSDLFFTFPKDKIFNSENEIDYLRRQLRISQSPPSSNQGEEYIKGINFQEERNKGINYQATRRGLLLQTPGSQLFSTLPNEGLLT
jgi:hypothetical protein